MDFRQTIADWNNWKGVLGQAVEFAEELGISRERIVSLARQAGDLLAEHVQPANPEQKTIKELWSVANDQEKDLLANLMTKLVTRPENPVYF